MNVFVIFLSPAITFLMVCPLDDFDQIYWKQNKRNLRAAGFSAYYLASRYC